MCRGILKNVFSVSGQEVVKASINLGEEVVIASGQRLGNSLQVRSAGGSEFTLDRIIPSTDWTKHW